MRNISTAHWRAWTKESYQTPLASARPIRNSNKCSNHSSNNNSNSYTPWSATKTSWINPHTPAPTTQSVEVSRTSTALLNSWTKWTCNPKCNLEPAHSNHSHPQPWTPSQCIRLRLKLSTPSSARSSHPMLMLKPMLCLNKHFPLWWAFCSQTHSSNLHLLTKERTPRIAEPRNQDNSVKMMTRAQTLPALKESWLVL